MTTRRKRTARQRIAEFYDDMAWKWERQREGFWCGFAFGCFIVLMAFYFAEGLTL